MPHRGSWVEDGVLRRLSVALEGASYSGGTDLGPGARVLHDSPNNTQRKLFLEAREQGERTEGVGQHIHKIS